MRPLVDLFVALLRRLNRCWPPTEYVVLVLTEAPTPSETVTAWNAYEAAPQTARSGDDALDSFRRDSGLTGPMIAVPASVWRVSRLRP